MRRRLVNSVYNRAILRLSVLYKKKNFNKQHRDEGKSKHNFDGECRVPELSKAKIVEWIYIWTVQNLSKIQYLCNINGGWERWAQIEISTFLARNGYSVQLEYNLFDSLKRIDLLVSCNDSNKSIAIELKCQTNRNDLNFDAGITKDTEKLADKLRDNMNISHLLAIGISCSSLYKNIHRNDVLLEMHYVPNSDISIIVNEVKNEKNSLNIPDYSRDLYSIYVEYQNRRRQDSINRQFLQQQIFLLQQQVFDQQNIIRQYEGQRHAFPQGISQFNVNQQYVPQNQRYASQQDEPPPYLFPPNPPPQDPYHRG